MHCEVRLRLLRPEPERSLQASGAPDHLSGRCDEGGFVEVPGHIVQGREVLHGVELCRPKIPQLPGRQEILVIHLAKGDSMPAKSIGKIQDPLADDPPEGRVQTGGGLLHLLSPEGEVGRLAHDMEVEATAEIPVETLHGEDDGVFLGDRLVEVGLVVPKPRESKVPPDVVTRTEETVVLPLEVLGSKEVAACLGHESKDVVDPVGVGEEVGEETVQVGDVPWVRVADPGASGREAQGPGSDPRLLQGQGERIRRPLRIIQSRSSPGDRQEGRSQDGKKDELTRPRKGAADHRISSSIVMATALGQVDQKEASSRGGYRFLWAPSQKGSPSRLEESITGPWRGQFAVARQRRGGEPK